MVLVLFVLNVWLGSTDDSVTDVGDRRTCQGKVIYLAVHSSKSATTAMGITPRLTLSNCLRSLRL